MDFRKIVDAQTELKTKKEVWKCQMERMHELQISYVQCRENAQLVIGFWRIALYEVLEFAFSKFCEDDFAT